jgi:general L-amino acid transport system permease protein
MEGTVPTRPSKSGKRKWNFWLRDERFLQVLSQLIFVAIVAGVGYTLFQNMSNALARQGMNLGYTFLQQTAGFDIKEALIAHTRSSPNLNAIKVAVLNTILVSVISIFISTIIGVLIGIARISTNFLINRMAFIYIEIFRNIPLLLVIIATYSVTVYNLPSVNNALALPGPVYVSNRGVYLPRPIPTETNSAFLTILVICLVIAVLLAVFVTYRYRLDSFIRFVIALGLFILFGAGAWFLLPIAPFTLEIPAKTGLNYTGGIPLSPELVAMIIGLVLGSSPFTADMVRAGVQQVSHGQVEAARALGLSGYKTMRFIVFPQAMRVIVPPMTSNYLSITKNSSLASAIAYPELIHVSSTITSQTGRAVEMMSIIMAIYLTLSLITSLFMNWYNNKVKIVER